MSWTTSETKPTLKNNQKRSQISKKLILLWLLLQISLKYWWIPNLLCWLFRKKLLILIQILWKNFQNRSSAHLLKKFQKREIKLTREYMEFSWIFLKTILIKLLSKIKSQNKYKSNLFLQELLRKENIKTMRRHKRCKSYK